MVSIASVLYFWFTPCKNDKLHWSICRIFVYSFNIYSSTFYTVEVPCSCFVIKCVFSCQHQKWPWHPEQLQHLQHPEHNTAYIHGHSGLQHPTTPKTVTFTFTGLLITHLNTITQRTFTTNIQSKVYTLYYIPASTKPLSCHSPSVFYPIFDIQVFALPLVHVVCSLSDHHLFIDHMFVSWFGSLGASAATSLSASVLIECLKKYSRGPLVCKDFLLQCSFSFSGLAGVPKHTKIAQFVNLLTDKGLAWVIPVWSQEGEKMVLYKCFHQLWGSGGP